ncbi:hypothetical protein NRIC_08100 [Enterococcus florum]|uniref:YokE-like PH domain-containing protein n=1 Tax=Enterococcus florum TaxID=2480627 RepID=A0A4V0WP79_9ENTE|nr:PH domain-containing protein [Enterococcus florum]GCF92919.1 hypothetical protein NRIC_08100 [Enterococcus florum]
MKHAEQMYTYCKERGYFSGSDRSFTLKLFEVIEKYLTPEEEVLLCFVGVHNRRSATSNEGFYAYALTNQRLMMGQKKLLGDDIKSLSLQSIQDIRLHKDSTTALLELHTADGPIKIMLTEYESEDIYQSLRHQLFHSVDSSSEKGTPPESAAEQLLKFKEMLDDQLITKEDFEKLKNEILS